MIHEHGDIVMLTVHEDAYDFKGTVLQIFYSRPDKTFPNGLPLYEAVDLGSFIPNYTIVGLSSKLSEDEWRGIVKEFKGYYLNYNEKYKSIYGDTYLITATASGLSLLKSKNLSPGTTLILKKQNSKI